MVGFGWAVKRAADGSRSGVNRLSMEIASFPATVGTVVSELFSYGTGEFRDKNLRVPRWFAGDRAHFETVTSLSGPKIEGLLVSADRGSLTRGWRLLAGVFSLDGKPTNAALLFSPNLDLTGLWILDEVASEETEPTSGYRRFVHGIELLSDGSLIFGFDHGSSLQRFDPCGSRLWATDGEFNHAVTLDDEETHVWSILKSHILAQVSVTDGRIVKQVNIDEVIEANRDKDPLEIRRAHDNDTNGNSRNTKGEWLADRYHLNDVNPLPSAWADRFEGFEAGDLLVSLRSLNMLMIVDPATLEIKWWRAGATRRQHDPDWLPDGTIAVLNNRMSEDFSQIVTIDPATYARSTLFDGRRNDFYTRIRGKQQVTPDSRLLVSSPQQGRAFELDKDGATLLEFVNTHPTDGRYNYALSEMRWYPPERFTEATFACLPKT
ncbi:MAG: hypothetical protein Kilf2KO_27960 [Rhodospirillales bacterium]